MTARKLNIVYVADIPQEGGASESLFGLAEALTRDYGFNCSVLFPSKGPLKERLDGIGVQTIVTGHRGFLVSRPQATWKVAPKYAIELIRYYASRSLAVRRAEKAVDFSQVDIIHSNLPRNDLGLMLARKHGIPHICHLREFSFEDFRCWSYRRGPQRYLSEGTDRFVAVSRACGEAWVRRGVDEDKVCVVYDGVDPVGFERVADVNAGRLCGGRLRLIFLGGCNAAKGIGDAVSAVATLPREVRGNVTLDIYGWGSRSTERAVMRRARELGIGDLVHVCGASGDVPTLLSGYDVGLMCSRSEAFGRVTAEYMMAGLAVIASGAGANPELIRDGVDGVLYAQGSPESLGKAIGRFAGNRAEVARMGASGRERARALFSDKGNARGIVAVYEDVLGLPAHTCTEGHI